MDPITEDRKGCWWLVLGFCSCAPVLALCVMVWMVSQFDGSSDFLIWFGLYSLWFIANVAVAWRAVLKLRRLYALEPAWTGKWQLTLSDLISVAFFAGFSMTLCRALAPNDFAPVGLTVAFCATAGYLVSLLFQSRMDLFSGFEKWFSATYFMSAVGVVLLFGIVLQIILIALLGALLTMIVSIFEGHK
jgi:hypothetical protein